MSPEEIREKIINDSSKRLKEIESSGGKTTSEYKSFLENLSQGRCPNCFKNLEIVEAKIDAKGFYYNYACGHGWQGITIKERFKIRESIELTKRPVGKRKFLMQMFHGYKASGSQHLPEGVEMLMIVDREKNEYHHVVKDNRTGETIHEEHESLNQHRSKN